MSITPSSGVPDRDLARAFAILGAFFLVATAGLYLYRLDWRLPFPRDGSTIVVGRDFLNFWMYGRAAAWPNPAGWYDAAAYQGTLATLLGTNYPGQNWSYPPSVMLIAAPFGLLSYLHALALWTALGLAGFVILARRHFADPRLLAAIVFSPAAVFCLISGQSSLVTAAILIGIFTWLDRRPLLAGLLIGLLTIKPQLGLLFPVMLIASERWRVFFAAVATALVLFAISAALFGPQAWIDFVEKGLPTQNLVLADPEGIATPYYPTLFMNLRGIGASYAVAMATQLCFSLAAIAAVAWAFRTRRDADPVWLMALFFACAIAAVPYLLAYDTLALCFAVLMLLEAGKLDARGRVLARFVYWLPLLQIGLGNLHIPGPALIAPAFALYAVMRLCAERPSRNAPDRERLHERDRHVEVRRSTGGGFDCAWREFPDQPEGRRRKCKARLRDRDDQRNHARYVILDELHLGDKRRQRGRVADAEPEQHHAEKKKRHARPSRRHEGDQARDLHRVAETGDEPPVGADRHQPAEKRATCDGRGGRGPHSEARNLRAKRRHQKREKMREEAYLREQPQRHRGGKRQEGEIAPEQ